jgi:hypothetical protein
VVVAIEEQVECMFLREILSDAEDVSWDPHFRVSNFSYANQCLSLFQYRSQSPDSSRSFSQLISRGAKVIIRMGQCMSM